MIMLKLSNNNTSPSVIVYPASYCGNFKELKEDEILKTRLLKDKRLDQCCCIQATTFAYMLNFYIEQSSFTFIDNGELGIS